jgi:L-asparagine oxygenase
VILSISGGPAEHASNRFEEVCNQIATPIVVQPGDVLIVNNRLSLHDRGGVGDEIMEKSRWLLRTYGLDTSSLPAHKRHLGGAPTYVLFP